MNITPQLLQQIVNYLITQPYTEVVNLIAEIQKQARVKPEEKKDEKETGA